VYILPLDPRRSQADRTAPRRYLIEKSASVWSGGTAALQADARVQATYLAV
jgi:ABC-type branched-subunit amino acid transport system ATPase component